MTMKSNLLSLSLNIESVLRFISTYITNIYARVSTLGGRISLVKCAARDTGGQCVRISQFSAVYEIICFHKFDTFALQAIFF